MSKKDRRLNLLDNRRDSITNAETNLQSMINDHLKSLRLIWDQVGMDEGQRNNRIVSVVTHVDCLFGDMISEEREMAEKLYETVKEYKEEITYIVKELHKPQYEIKSTKSLLDAECELRLVLEDLRTEKYRRMKIYGQLFDEDSEICKQMNIAVYSIAPNVVPTERQLNELKFHIEQNRRDRDYRRGKLIEFKTKIMRLMAKLNLTPKSDIEKQILMEAVDNLPLTSEFLRDLDVLQTELQTRFDLYLESVRQQFGQLKEKLESLWKICHVDQAQSSQFRHADEEDFDEDALKRYNVEIAKWEAYYEERQDVLDKIDLWIRLWNEKLQYEAKDRDANRLLNRGGALLQEEKDRNKLEKRLPNIQKEIKTLLGQWNAGHPRQPILMEGRPVLEYLERIQRDYMQVKEKEKLDKQMAKKQQLEAERFYGASPVTPNKKRFGGSIRRVNTPTNQNNENCTTGLSKMYVHSSLALVRSPAQASAAALGAKPPVSKPAGPGLPRPVTKNSFKRRADERFVPLSQVNRSQESSPTPSSDSYEAFVQKIRAKDSQVQSSFVDPTTPTKIRR